MKNAHALAQEEILDYLRSDYRKKFAQADAQEKNGKSRELETLFSNLGALAGFGCQIAIREALVKKGIMPIQQAFTRIYTEDKETFFYGDHLNEPLLSTEEDRISVYSLVAGPALDLGVEDLPDREEIAGYYASKIGHKEFYEPRLPPEHMPRELPVTGLRHWGVTNDIQIKHKIEPLFWGWTYAMIAQKLIYEVKDTFSPGLAAKIVMEAAIPMSKMDPISIDTKYAQAG
ncbi:MAG: hypothetical protein KDI90_06540 [Alphaproteobacteria bacterium]|nr:hypothetical protein [Alphaproteobacteria bacterium]MCB9974972.1 hypothetical protein [Rhodospirillales bacterium]